MVEHKPDFMKDYQAFAQQSWDAWARQWQQAAPPSLFQPPPSPSSFMPAGNEALERSLDGLKSYLEWLQSALTGGVGQGTEEWRQQLQRLFAMPGSELPGAAFAQSFAAGSGFGGAKFDAMGFAPPWEWPGASGAALQNMQMPAFGYSREQQEQWKALAAAFAEYLETCKRYQALLLQAHVKGVERLQDKLEGHTEPGQQVDSLKGLYDLWVDSAEEAYATIAQSDEFRAAYGSMVDAQMRLRQQQQQQVEQWSRELGMPTRSEVDTLGKRLQEIRREFRAAQSGQREQATELAALRVELAEWRRKAAAPAPNKTAVKTSVVGRSATVARKSAAVKSASTRTAKKTPAGNGSRKHS